MKSGDTTRGKTARRYRAVLFDLDGTLLDTIEDISRAMNRVLTRRGFPGHSIAEYKYLVGEGMDELVRRSLPADQENKKNIADCVRELKQEYTLDKLTKTTPYPGIPELLDSLASGGFRMAILSNKPDDSTRALAGRLLSRWDFEKIAGARPSIPLKPDPTMAAVIAREMGISPEQFICVGDTEIDMLTARAARMYPAGALWGFRTRDELEAGGAMLFLATPDDLRSFLDVR